MKHKMYWKFCSSFLIIFTCPELSRETRWKLTSNFCGFFGKESGMKVMRAENSCLHGGASSKRRGKKRAAGPVMLFSGFKAPNCPLISLRARSESCAFVARVRHSMPLFYWTTSSERCWWETWHTVFGCRLVGCSVWSYDARRFFSK